MHSMLASWDPCTVQMTRPCIARVSCRSSPVPVCSAITSCMPLPTRTSQCQWCQGSGRPGALSRWPGSAPGGKASGRGGGGCDKGRVSLACSSMAAIHVTALPVDMSRHCQARTAPGSLWEWDLQHDKQGGHMQGQGVGWTGSNQTLACACPVWCGAHSQQVRCRAG